MGRFEKVKYFLSNLIKNLAKNFKKSQKRDFQFCYLEIKNPPAKVGGKQLRWVKQSIVSPDSDNSERLFNLKEANFVTRRVFKKSNY